MIFGLLICKKVYYIHDYKTIILKEVQDPLACEESNLAPLASLESANSSDLQSM